MARKLGSLTADILHADFQAVKAGEKVDVEVTLVVTGETAPGTVHSVEEFTILVKAPATSIPENLDPTQTEVLRAYFAYDKATWRLWFRNEGLDTMDTVATGQLLTEITHNAAKMNGQLSRPPVRISVSEVTASDDGNGYAIAACLDKTQMTTVDAQGNDITSPKSQIRKPIIAFMTQGTDGTWRASQEDSGTPNTCSVN